MQMPLPTASASANAAAANAAQQTAQQQQQLKMRRRAGSSMIAPGTAPPCDMDAVVASGRRRISSSRSSSSNGRTVGTRSNDCNAAGSITRHPTLPLKCPIASCYVQDFTPCQLRFTVLLLTDGWIMGVACMLMTTAIAERVYRIACIAHPTQQYPGAHESDAADAEYGGGEGMLSCSGSDSGHQSCGLSCNGEDEGNNGVVRCQRAQEEEDSENEDDNNEDDYNEDEDGDHGYGNGEDEGMNMGRNNRGDNAGAARSSSNVELRLLMTSDRHGAAASRILNRARQESADARAEFSLTLAAAASNAGGGGGGGGGNSGVGGSGGGGGAGAQSSVDEDTFAMFARAKEAAGISGTASQLHSYVLRNERLGEMI
jgi:hypothetical protein